MLLETFLACNCVALASKMVYTDVEKVAEIKKNILENGLYHITREESADKILQSGYIRPSGNFLSLGRKKVFFFAGIPEPDLIRENILELYRQYEWTAIKVMPNEKDLDRYKTRVLGDNSIICIGKQELEENKVQKVKLVLDINKEGKLYIREKTKEEIEKGVYEPSKEVKEKFGVQTNPLVATQDAAKSYINIFRRLFSKAKEAMHKKEDSQQDPEKLIAIAQSERKNFLERLLFRVENKRKEADRESEQALEKTNPRQKQAQNEENER